ncbi:hypothetical protein NVP1254O_21 [Vibrio phage 1.254.O._10N.286.45.C8]|nr:hypothetical protein NVP1254O_21 [Vibrio phage 1.254.O._10N.286.45.C8]
MRILFIGGYADGKFIDVNPVEFENPNDADDYHIVMPELFRVAEEVPPLIVSKDWGSFAMPEKVRAHEYRLNKMIDKTTGDPFEFYSLLGMSELEVVVAFSHFHLTSKA